MIGFYSIFHDPVLLLLEKIYNSNLISKLNVISTTMKSVIIWPLFV